MIEIKRLELEPSWESFLHNKGDGHGDTVDVMEKEHAYKIIYPSISDDNDKQHTAPNGGVITYDHNAQHNDEKRLVCWGIENKSIDTTQTATGFSQQMIKAENMVLKEMNFVRVICDGSDELISDIKNEAEEVSDMILLTDPCFERFMCPIFRRRYYFVKYGKQI